MKWTINSVTNYGSWTLIPTLMYENIPMPPPGKFLSFGAYFLQWGIEVHACRR